MQSGLGKTVEMLALCLANPPPPPIPSGEKDANGRLISRATLIVCEKSLMGHWVEEAKSKTADSMSIHT